MGRLDVFILRAPEAKRAGAAIRRRRGTQRHVSGRLSFMAVILFSAAALKVVGALAAMGVGAWVVHALGR